MNTYTPPILLTSCIHVADHSVKLVDPTERINHTLESIEKWLAILPETRLVVCDSSDFDFTDLVKQHFPHANIECLAFEADRAAVKRHGKGYGEGEIVKYAVTHSTYINQSDFFAKCTAKLWVDNFLQCLSEWNGTFKCHATFRNVFSFKPTRLDHIDTRFYLVGKQFYWKYLADAHLNLGAETGLSIEDNFREVVLKNELRGVLFSHSPVICGVGGATGKYYNISLTKRFKEKLRLLIARNSTKFRYLFNG